MYYYYYHYYYYYIRTQRVYRESFQIARLSAMLEGWCCGSCCRAWITLAVTLVVSANVAGLSSADDKSCDGYQYEGMDWGELRSTFEIYADKYLDRPQLLAKEFQFAKTYAFGYHPENRCVLGDLTVRFFVWLSLDPMAMRSAVAALAAGHLPNDMMGEVLQETFDLFWNLDISWSEVHGSGWPLFSVLAAVSERLRDDGQELCATEEQLQPFIDSFDTAVTIDADATAELLLEARRCPDAVAAALLAMADNLRTTTWQQDRNRYFQFTCSPADSQPPERDAEKLLARVEALLRGERSWSLLTSRWPVWRLLDRLGAREVVRVVSDTSWFWMFVFPHRVRSDGLISNRIRATSKAYCLQLFQEEVKRLAAETPARPLRLVEAGPHIGDCMLWAAAELGERVRASAIEPVTQVVSLFRRSVSANSFEHLIDLHHAWLGASPSEVAAGSMDWSTPIPWISIDSILDEDIDVFKIHTNGGERQILDGAERLFSKHKVRVVLVHSAEAHQLWPSAEFLLQRGYSVSVDGRRLSLEDEGWLRGRVEEVGGLQLHALAA
eukprot:TRINITY_DN111730_c0_g1_i1.p1 TRINITY_DN111730_c0_g1~~TRINITY_DN111730_c0_g1_i1.p1  ORF type:complete len:553 (-),score=132.66 TRINITY_DN111730_c0_g1_i1:7-1665(-)